MNIQIKPTKKQHTAYGFLLDNKTNFIFFGGGAGGGKSWLGAEWLFMQAERYPNTKWFIGRHELKRLMSSSYITFQKVLRHHGVDESLYKLNGQYNYIDFPNGSRIDLLDLAFKPADPDYQRLGSLEYTGGWIEEAGEVDFGAFDMLKTRVGRHLNKEYDLTPKIFCTCNPARNWLYRDVYKPWRNKTLPDNYAFIQSLYGDNPHTAEDYSKMLQEIKSVVTRKRLMLGYWEYEDDLNILIKRDAILDMLTNTVPKGKRFLIVDVARYGQDKIVAYFFEGWHVKKVWIWGKQGIDVTAMKLEQIAMEERVPYSHILADEGGVGGGVVDIMRGIKGFMANARPMEEDRSQYTKSYKKVNYKNLKTQCSYILADKINSHNVSFRDFELETDVEGMSKEKFFDMLDDELSQIKAKDIEKDTNLQIIPKDEVKEALGRSPDFSDTLMMRVYFDLNKPKTKKRSPYIPSHSIYRN